MEMNDKRLLTCKEAAKFLGISESALRKRIFLRQVRGLCRLGSRLYFDKRKLDQFIDEIEISQKKGAR